jgi:hypothetical protein
VLGRRQKKALRAVLAQAAAQTWPSLVEFSTLTLAIERSAWCVAYALSGDLLATIDAVRTVRMGLAQRTDSATEGSLWALVEDPIAGEVIRFAMSERATELREQMTFAGG